MIKYLKNKLDVVEVSFENFTKAYYECIVFNISQCKNIKEEDMQFKLFTILENDKSKAYYDDIETRNAKDVHVIFERKSGIITSSSGLLSVELDLFKGVSEEEYYNEGIVFRQLIADLEIEYERKNPYIFEEVLKVNFKDL
ncbi:hypothetical protein [Peptoniphilus porci]|uniref:Uncharacterized protein n=1 Tax=Peptoniphilus porci TaxID=2652280 RepID=A0A1U7M197_9FIRM|nr:hypothetical protein [Peptoniphilus porci]OLR65326.1 hypothetical protein BIV18_07280 [Peptoniphilus porci]